MSIESNLEHKKPKDPRPPANQTQCCIGCVESNPNNEGTNAAVICQSISQTSMTILLCGDCSPRGMCLEGLSDAPIVINSDNDGNITVNGKPMEVQELEDGVKLFIFKKENKSSKVIGGDDDKVKK